MLKILFVGYGNIALRHIDNVKVLKEDSEIRVLRCSSKDDVENKFVTSTFWDLKDALKWCPDIVFITSPSPFHIEMARTFGEQGAHLYIEKPISNNLDGIEGLKKIIKEKEIVVTIGYHLRFSSVLQALKTHISNDLIGKVFSVRAEVGQWLPDWRPFKDYTTTVTANKSLGGGALLELSHEIDYLHYLFGDVSAVFCSMSSLSDLQIDVEDNVEMIVKFRMGVVGSIHLDLLRRDVTRKCTLIGKKGTLEVDFLMSKLYFYCSDKKQGQILFDGSKYNSNKAYLDSLDDFFNAVTGKSNLRYSVNEGIRTLVTLITARKSASEGQFITLS